MLRGAEAMLGGWVAAGDPLALAYLFTIFGALLTIGPVRRAEQAAVVFWLTLAVGLALILAGLGAQDGTRTSAFSYAIAGFAIVTVGIVRTVSVGTLPLPRTAPVDAHLLVLLAGGLGLCGAQTILEGALWLELVGAIALVLHLERSGERSVLTLAIRQAAFAAAGYALAAAFLVSGGGSLAISALVPAPSPPDGLPGARAIGLLIFAAVLGLRTAGIASLLLEGSAAARLVAAGVLFPAAVSVLISVLGAAAGAKGMPGLALAGSGVALSGAVILLAGASARAHLAGLMLVAAGVTVLCGAALPAFDLSAARLCALAAVPALAALALALSAIEAGAAGEPAVWRRAFWVTAASAGGLSIAGAPPFTSFFVRISVAEGALRAGRPDVLAVLLILLFAALFAGARFGLHALGAARPHEARGMEAASPTAAFATALFLALTIASLLSPDPLFAVARGGPALETLAQAGPGEAAPSVPPEAGTIEAADEEEGTP